MNRVAIRLSVAMFFVLAAVGCLSDVPTLICGLRAAAGAAGTYVLAVVAGRLILAIMVDTVVKAIAANRKAGGDVRK